MQVLTRIPYILALILLVYMPFHVFLSQSLSLVTGGLDAWKIGKDVLLGIGVLFTICLVWQQKKGTRASYALVALAGVYGLLHAVLWLTDQDAHDRSAIIGTIYNMRLPLFAILGYGAALLWPKFVFSSVIRVVLLVGTVVAGLGVIQYFLPSDLLTHLGYGLERGARAAFFIDDHPDLPRIMATLREPNALGAYLILPLAALVAYLLRTRDHNKRIMLIGAAMLHLLAIFLTFSRSAWLAVIAALIFVAWWRFGRTVLQLIRRFWPAVLGVLLVVSFAVFALRNTPFFQQYIIHSNPEEQVADLDSNDLHILLIQEGLQGIADAPLGHGPGTAGLASIQNPNGGQLTENYYVQIGYEVGIAGFLLFLVLTIWLYVAIRRRGGYAAVILCASFWAYVVTNMLLHTWSNEAVAAQWWILAGVTLAMLPGGRAGATTRREAS